MDFLATEVTPALNSYSGFTSGVVSHDGVSLANVAAPVVEVSLPCWGSS